MYFTGVDCESYEDLLNTDGASGGKNLPPFKDDASYALYGQACTAGKGERLVAQRAVILKDGVNTAMLVARSGSYGDMPLVIEDGSQISRVETIARSE